jgi:hypothetical protein
VARFSGTGVARFSGTDTLGEKHLRNIVMEYVEHYHVERNHQGRDNELIDAQVANTNGKRAVRCRERLGGTLRYYYRDAA